MAYREATDYISEGESDTEEFLIELDGFKAKRRKYKKNSFRGCIEDNLLTLLCCGFATFWVIVTVIMIIIYTTHLHPPRSHGT